MGGYTQHDLFYKPTYGEAGEANADKFNDALEVADAAIKANEQNAEINVDLVRHKTTVEIQAICNAGTANQSRIFYNTTRRAYEIWHGFSLAKVV